MAILPPTKRVLDFLTSATTCGTEASLEQLFEILELTNGSTLDRVIWAEELLSGLGLRMLPDLRKGALDTVRRVLPIDFRDLTPGAAASEIAEHESSGLELKSSLMYHHARAANDPRATAADLRSEEVVHSVLKSIAAFLTSGGGILYVGVRDDCKILGIEFDFKLLNAEGKNADGWELHLRNLIKGNFKDGDNVNDYMQVKFLEIDGMYVSRIQVGPRRKLSFLKFKNSYHLFRRQGNRTEEITIEQIEEFLAVRAASA